MEEPMRIQLAWKIIELLETLADFILECYIDDPFDDAPRENPNNKDAFTD